MENAKTGIEIKIIQWPDEQKEIALHFRDLDQMITFSAASARNFAFLLMECSDQIEPPF